MQRLETAQATSLEIPPISLARYLDLVKRRRWQVIPISAAGLLIGLIVALLIPRYYVAQTTVEYRGDLLDMSMAASGRRDPMAPIVSAAQIRIPYLAEQAAERLGWPEAVSAGDAKRIGFFRAVRERITVDDLGPSGIEMRQLAHLRITYRDTDGPRARAFVAALRDEWTTSERKALQDDIQADLSALNRQIDTLVKTVNSLGINLRAMEREFEINPEDRRVGGNALVSMRTAGLDADRQRLDALNGEIESLQLAITQLGTDIEEGTVAPRIPRPALDDVERQAGQQLIAGLEAELRRIEFILHNLTSRNEQRAGYEEAAQLARTRLQEARELLSRRQEQETIVNPEYAALVTRRQTAEQDLMRRQGERRTLLARITQREEQLRALQGVFPAYDALLKQLQEASEQRLALTREQTALQHRLTRVQNDGFRIIEPEFVPSRPTEPNVTIVALAGSAVGLGFAIALILLLDALRFTFKTVDDVERGLPLPLLGGLSHMESAEERAATTHKRRRAAVVTAAFLVLIVALVVIYYVAPDRLPAFVVEGLDLLLGAQK